MQIPPPPQRAILTIALALLALASAPRLAGAQDDDLRLPVSPLLHRRSMEAMFWLLALLFLIVPIVEIYVIVQVADGLGWPETILLLIGISVLGAWLVKREGFGVLARIQQRLDEGRLPTGELVDGALVLIAGALLLTPGFVTDGIGFLLLIPPTRAVARRLVMRRLRSRLRVYTVRSDGTGNRRWRYRSGDVFDVDETRPPQQPPEPGGREQLGP